MKQKSDYIKFGSLKDKITRIVYNTTINKVYININYMNNPIRGTDSISEAKYHLKF